MFGILCAIATETIIGIVAIIVIILSVGIIVATAVRNYLLHKKMIAENGGDESFINNDEAQEIDENNENVDDVQENIAEITAQDEVNAAEIDIDDLKSEFADGEAEEFGEVQQIVFANETDNDINVASDDIKGAEIADNPMEELEEKLAEQ